MHYTRSTIARKLRRIARLLRYADFARARIGLEDAIHELKDYSGILNSFEKALNEKAMSSFSNFLTSSRTLATNNFFFTSFKQFKELYPKALQVLKQAQNTSSLKDMKDTIHYNREPLDKILALMVKIKSTFDNPDVTVPFDSRERRIKSAQLGYQNFVDGINHVLDAN